VQAVTLLGTDLVLRWATLLAMAGNDDCPVGYLESALQRARMCELLAGAFGAPEAYIIGLLSALDVVLNAPLADLVAPLPIDNRFKRALLEREGVLGSVRDTVTAYESGKWPGQDGSGAGSPAASSSIQRAFWDAAEYSRAMIAGLKGVTAPAGPAPGAAAREPQPEPA
jgi:c-di-GMP phosphodiesterase